MQNRNYKYFTPQADKIPDFGGRRFKPKLTWLEKQTGLTLTELWLAVLFGGMLWLCMAALYFGLTTLAAMFGAI